MIPNIDLRAIDPLALILSPEVYARIHLPDPPPDAYIAAHVKQAVSGLSAQEKQDILARARVLGAYAHTVQKTLG